MEQKKLTLADCFKYPMLRISINAFAVSLNLIFAIRGLILFAVSLEEIHLLPAGVNLFAAVFVMFVYVEERADNKKIEQLEEEIRILEQEARYQ